MAVVVAGGILCRADTRIADEERPQSSKRRMEISLILFSFLRGRISLVLGQQTQAPISRSQRRHHFKRLKRLQKRDNAVVQLQFTFLRDKLAMAIEILPLVLHGLVGFGRQLVLGAH
ncbi:hypothetical protein PF003_g22446 [Phytophthora fragariae]|nr:hypothetical protein PF003_g22446 [Phytophthora fragariae]